VDLVSACNSHSREIFHNSLDSETRERKGYRSVCILGDRYDPGVRTGSRPGSSDVGLVSALHFSHDSKAGAMEPRAAKAGS
jgi:hypothetical protein